MPMMNGEQYRQSILDGRRCYIDGERIEDPSKHPMLSTPVDAVAAFQVTNQVVGGSMHEQRMATLDTFDLTPVKARARAAAGIN